MSHHAAKIILDLAIGQIGEQNEILKAVEGECTAEEFAEYKRAIGGCMGTMIFEIINPIIAQYPHLTPTESSWIETAIQYRDRKSY